MIGVSRRLAPPKGWLWPALLEIGFWLPFFAVPILAKLIVGEQVPRGEMVAGVLLTALLAAIGGHLGRFQIAYRIALYPVLALGALIVTGMALSRQGFLNPFVLLAIIDTDTVESTEFVRRFGLMDLVLTSLLLIPLLPLIIQARRRLLPPPVPYAAIAILALIAVHVGARTAQASVRAARENEHDTLISGVERFGREASGYAAAYMPLRPYLALGSALAMRWEIAALAREAAPVEGVKTLEGDGSPRTYVVVVGEALSKRHMRLYGYGQDTTPGLSGLAASGQMTVFNDVVTSHAMTIPALQTAFRFRAGQGQDGHTLFDVLNGAGFQTYWISNQYQNGIYESGVSLLTSATNQRWLTQPLLGGMYGERRDFDEKLLPELRKVLAQHDRDRFIFVHLMGNHDAYRARYPASAEYFRKLDRQECLTQAQSEKVVEYDNAVRYNDAVVTQIVDAVRDAAGPHGDSFVLYLSDHGEEVYDFRDFAGHNDSMLSPHLAEVPFMLLLSDGYKQRHDALAERLAAARSRAYDTSDLLYSIADLAHLSFPGMDLTRSVFSANFTPRTRMTANRDYDAFKRNWAADADHAQPAALLQCEPAVKAAQAQQGQAQQSEAE